MRILIICGRAYSGKSTAAKYIQSRYEGWQEIRLADYIKNECSTRYNLDRSRLDGISDEDRVWRETRDSTLNGKSPRELLIKIGTEMRDKDKYILPRIAKEKIIDSNIHTIISDCRFQSDIDYLRSKLEVKVVKLQRSDVDFITIQESLSPALLEQEKAVDDIDPDHIVITSSIEDTYKELDNILKLI